MSGDTNGIERINRNEFEQACGEMVANIVELQEAFNALRRATNTQAEVLGCHRFILEKFVPLPLLEQAAKDYYAQRQREIATETTPPGNA
jgi:hypothetical protein